jgi:succinate dehydrogenase/fumarate reductase flavoprotein subunit
MGNAQVSRRSFIAGAAALGASGAVAGMTATAFADEGGEGDYLTAEKASQKWAFEIAPDPIADDQIAETIEADIVVLGAGTSGLVTAVSALEEGLTVVIPTASTKPISRGGSNHAINSKQMEAMGIDPEPWECLEKEIFAQYGNVDTLKWHRFYENSETAMNWLIDIMEEAGYKTGLEVSSTMDRSSLHYQYPASHGWYLDDSDSIGMTQPYVVDTLAQKVVDLGGAIYYSNVGEQLVKDGDRVVGVVCRREDGTYAKFVGVKAVVLATGDFSANRDMMAKYCPQCADRVADEVYDTVDYDREFVFGGLYPGDGQRMGLWAGAAWQKTFPNAPMGGITLTSGPNCRPYSQFWGLLVNRDGQRFMNEYASSVVGGGTQYLQPGSASCAIWDSAYANHPNWNGDQGTLGVVVPKSVESVRNVWENNVEDGTYVKADTLEELVEKMGLPAEETLATIARYNQLCDWGTDVDFGKTPDELYHVAEPPFYGQVTSGTDCMPVLTVMGGLRTDASMRVCDENDDPIPGLYNVGTMVGDFYAGTYTFQEEGINYGACCITFGYLTGKAIAAL